MNEYLYFKVSHSDKELTERLAKELEEAGHKVWLSQGPGEGDSQQERQTRFAIERSDAFLLGLSPALLAEEGAGQELALAQEADKPIFLAQLEPADLPPEWQTALAGRPAVDLSDDFEAGLAELLSSLAGSGATVVAATTDVATMDAPTVDAGAVSGNFFGGEYFGRVPALAGEEIAWSDSGLYWYKKWNTLVRVLITLTNRRLIFFWDSRDIWKWKPRESDELEEAFPMILALDQITDVPPINKPKSFLIFATGRPYVDIMVAGNQPHRFSLESDFEARIDQLRDAAGG